MMATKNEENWLLEGLRFIVYGGLNYDKRRTMDYLHQ